MDYSNQLSMSYYKTIAVLNESHKIYLVQHLQTRKIYVKKILAIYNLQVYEYLRKHPIQGTPQIIEFYENENQLVLIEEYITGTTLQEKMDNATLNPSLISQYILELCHILNALHHAAPPIIHRDIKPSNIIITPYNQVVLLDFNAAKFYSQDSTSDTILLGTKGYAAPEQYGFGASTMQTDIYALGILLKEMTSSVASSSCNSKFNSIITKCTQMNPTDRYSTVSELMDDLTSCSDCETTHLAPTQSSRSWLPPGYRSKTPWHILLATLMYICIFWLCLSLEVKDVTYPVLWLERIFTLFMLLSVVFCSFNYLDIQRFLPLCKNRNPAVRVLGIIILDVFSVFALLILMLIIEELIFN